MYPIDLLKVCAAPTKFVLTYVHTDVDDRRGCKSSVQHRGPSTLAFRTPWQRYHGWKASRHFGGVYPASLWEQVRKMSPV